MCRLAAYLLTALQLLGILNRNSSLCILQYDNEDNHSYNNCQNDQSCKNSLRNRLVRNELAPQSSKILWHTRNNVDDKHDRNTVSDSLFCDSFTDPHKHCRSCSKPRNNHNHSKRAFTGQIISTIEGIRQCNCLEQTKSNCHVTGDRSNLLSAFFAVTLHFLKLWNGDCQ